MSSGGGLGAAFNASASNAGVAKRQGQSAGQFAASFITAIAVFAIQAGIFLLIKDRFARIYQPRTYLVPPKERTKPVDPGWWKWIKPVLHTSNSEFVQRCGLDAYFFLRYLRTLLKIFVPAALVILPILLPLNAVHGRGGQWALPGTDTANQTNVTGLDVLAWGNVAPDKTSRYWAHFILAFMLIVYICFIAYDELRNYIRMRQAYITSPQHRLRASATTVLVSSIPTKWCNVEALNGLYDVFPGGLRNIWINRNFDELNDKVKRRDKLALTLESAETDLIKKCYKKNEENIVKAEKEAGKTLSKEEQKQRSQNQDQKGQRQAQSTGVSSGNPHQIKHDLVAAADGTADYSSTEEEEQDQTQSNDSEKLHIPIIGGGIQAVAESIGAVGRGLLGGVRGVNRGLNNTIDTTNGFVATEDHDQANHETQQDGTRTSYDQLIARKPLPVEPPREQEPRQSLASNRKKVHDASAKNDAGYNCSHERAGQHSPISESSTVRDKKAEPDIPLTKFQKFKQSLGFKTEGMERVDYPSAFEAEFEHDPDDALWRKYLTDKDRDTMRLPINGWQWMFALPFIGPKVDTIRYCREEVAKLNLEIEDDQAHPERFPLMNSAFVQFNHQVAAHMACQSVSHHFPKQMAPRLVEIDPNDVIWDNMSIPWWQSYIRTAGVVTVVIGMIVLWAIPVAFTSALSQLTTAAQTYPWLAWVMDIPSWFRSVLQGVLPAALLGLLLFLLPIILRALIRLQGTQSGVLVELSVQRYYFFFLFIQLFLIVTVASSVVQFLSTFTSVDGLVSIPSLLGSSIPKASNYFISYMLLQALSVSAGALLQIGALIGWFVLAPILDSTARSKFNRQTNLSDIQWGTFFPVYTNLACIGLIYSVISPLILIFNIITFALFWFVYRYNTLYVTRFTRDTGGLLYPNAINYTFVGVYMMEVALIGMFFLVRDENNNVSCYGQGLGMVIILALTIGYQLLLNNAFSPLFTYLPITLEDDAVRRDEEFARAMQVKHGLLDNELEDEDIEDQLEEREERERQNDQNAQEYEMRQIEAEKRERHQQMEMDKQQRPRRQKTEPLPELEPYEWQVPEVSLDLDKHSKGTHLMKKAAKKTADTTMKRMPSVRNSHNKSWADRDNARNRRASNFGSYDHDTVERIHSDSQTNKKNHSKHKGEPIQVMDRLNNFNPITGKEKDVEAQRAARGQLADALFAGLHDELEDLTPDQRDTLVQRAYQHSALRARRPVIWLPRDELGVSDDEVHRIGRFSKNLWVSNVRQGLDSKGRCIYSGAPPDFTELDLIQL